MRDTGFLTTPGTLLLATASYANMLAFSANLKGPWTCRIERNAMSRDINETDWKLLRELFPIAQERLCGRILEEIEHINTDTSKSTHQRYLDIYQLILRRDKEIACAFNDLRRSTALIRLVTILSQRLLMPEEFARFSPETHSFVEMLDRRPA